MKSSTVKNALFGSLVATGLVFASHAPALAQKKPAPAAAKKAADPKGSWIKLCHKDVPVAKDKRSTVCEVMQAKLNPLTGFPLSSVTFRYDKAKAKQVAISVTMPLGMALRRGVALLVDDEKQPILTIPFSVCLESGCVAEAPVNSIVLDKFRKSGVVKTVSLAVSGRPYGQALTLKGFSKTWDGKPIDKKEFIAARKSLAKMIQANRKNYVEKLKKQRADAAGKKAGEKKKP